MKKIFAAFLILMLILSCAIPALAMTKTQDGLEVTVNTDKRDYHEGDVIRISLNVRNTGNNPVYDVQAEYKLPSGLILPEGVSSTVSIGQIAPGQNKTYTRDFKVITKQQIVKLPQTGDSSNPGLWALIGAGALLAILAIKKEQRKQLFALALCCALAGNAFGGFSTSASAENKYVPATLDVYEPITLNGKPEEAGVIVSYNKLASDIPVASISLNKQSVTLGVGESEQLSASVLPSDATNQEIEWTSSDSAVAAVDETGKITAIAAGTATITAAAKDGSGVQSACSVTVTEQIPPVGMPSMTINGSILSGSSVTDVVIGQLNLTWSAEHAASYALDIGIFEKPEDFASEDLRKYTVVNQTETAEQSATISAANVTTLLENGKCWKIVLTAKGADGSTQTLETGICIQPQLVTAITLNLTSMALEIGRTDQLTATITPENATDRSLLWASSDESVATVSETGMVTGVAAGSATITATAKDGSGVSAACKVTVENPNRCGEKLYWLLSQDGMLKIYGQGDMYSTYLAADQLPWHALRSQIQSVIVEENATGIADYSFYGCANLAEASLPDSLNKLGSSAFEACTALTEITIPGGVSELPEKLFDGCASLRSVKLPKQLEKIGRRAFADCVSLSNMTEY